MNNSITSSAQSNSKSAPEKPIPCDPNSPSLLTFLDKILTSPPTRDDPPLMIVHKAHAISVFILSTSSSPTRPNPIPIRFTTNSKCLLCHWVPTGIANESFLTSNDSGRSVQLQLKIYPLAGGFVWPKGLPDQYKPTKEESAATATGDGSDGTAGSFKGSEYSRVSVITGEPFQMTANFTAATGGTQ